MAGPLAATLLGTAIGDALGLPCEGLNPAAIARRFPDLARFHLVGRTGYVSDDTELSALIAQSLARHPADPDACVRDFRRALLGWFARLPWGVGMATVRACLRIALHLRPTGVMSAGNGAAMRAAIVGVAFRDDPARRAAFGRPLAEVTHRDPRAVAAALFVAELAAACARATPDADRAALVREALAVVHAPNLAAALDQAVALAARDAARAEAARTLGTSGFVVRGVPFATFVFLRHGGDLMTALTEVIRAGGDTDSNAAILGAWLGALLGEVALPAALLAQVHDGPFGPTHLRALADCLARRVAGEPSTVPRYSTVAALMRNLALYPVILAHGLRRLLPF